jgi:hypothetical protein
MTKIIIKKVVSGGQTGVDRAALDFAGQLGLNRGGWCPKGRLALDGRIPDEYPLKETPSSSYSQRTQWNVRDSDGTLIICRGPLTGGTALTHRLAQQLEKPSLVLDLTHAEVKKEVAWQMLVSWLQENEIQTVNIAGPRERDQSGIYAKTFNFLCQFWQEWEQVEMKRVADRTLALIN